MHATTFAWLVLLFPLVGTIVIGAGWRVLPGRTAGWLGTLMIALSFVAAVIALIQMLDLPPDGRELTSSLWTYAKTTGLNVRMGILLDPLSEFMILIVSGVSMLIHLYSVSYLTGDAGYRRYFAYLNFFVFSMLLLVLAGNFFVLIIGWAFVGAASYLLISFWYRRNTATSAGIKAFVINVVGDVGLVLGTFFILKHLGTVDFAKALPEVPKAFSHNQTDLVVAGLCFLVGAFAKSAQVPLHTWLPDAMEGPTPVSALIHAATMVTAGVYLIARLHTIFNTAPTAATIGAILGCATLLIAGTIALVVTDLKRVIAYSTMSQIGYMVMGACIGAYSAAMFHLMTHAFFKALLFMAAGSIIGAMAGVQSLDRMHGFRKAMPFTFACFIVGGVALAGIPPFSGGFSKDEILAFATARGGGYYILAALGYFGAFLTGIYTFRMIFRAFYGEPSPEARELEEGHLAHAEVPTNPMTGEEEDTHVGFPGPGHFIAERELPMKVAMSLLALLAVVAGLTQIPGVDDAIHNFLAPVFANSPVAQTEVSTTRAWICLLIGAAAGLAGIAVAYRLYIKRTEEPARLRERFAGIHHFLANKWYFDDAIDAVFVRPATAVGRWSYGTFERVFVNGFLVGGTTGIVRAGSAAVRGLQNGLLRYYAALLILGLAATTLYFLIKSS